jgi:hypothetical protein
MTDIDSGTIANVIGDPQTRVLFDWDRDLLLGSAYIGLRPFKKAEWPIFCGRANITEEILEVLGRRHFAFIIGASGCGKSSLVRAGVLATVEGCHGMVGVRWRTATMTPGPNPLWRLAEATLQARAGNKTHSGRFQPDQTAEYSIRIQHADSGLAIIRDLVDAKANENLLLLVDQFEELFRFDAAEDEEERKRFVELLARVQRERPQGLYVIATMRAEFIGECTHYRGLADVVNRTAYLVRPMSLKDMRQAITQPARLKGGIIENKLTKLLLREVGGREDDLPILQHTLSWMWSEAEQRSVGEKCHSTGSPAVVLTLDRYIELKGDDTSLISRHGEAIYNQLSSREREIAEVMFRRMVSVGGVGSSLRRPTRFSSIAEISRAECAEVETVANHFAAEGASFVHFSRTPGDQDANIDITHESLIRQWHRLSEWQRAERRSYETYRDLNRAAERRRNLCGDLWSGNELASAIAWRTDQRPTVQWARRYKGDFAQAMEFLLQSEHRERAEAQAHKDAEDREHEAKLEKEKIRARQAEAEREVAALKAKAKIETLQRRIGIILGAVLAGAVILFFWLRNVETEARDVVSSLSRMDAIALDSGPDFRRRLLVLRASLLRSLTPASLGPMWLTRRSVVSNHHKDTLAVLKRSLLRAPEFVAQVDAVGTNLEGTKIVVLTGDGVEQYELKHEVGLAKARHFSITETSVSESPLLAQAPSAIGFVGERASLVAAVVRAGILSYWTEEEKNDSAPNSFDLKELLPFDLLKAGSYSMVGFEAGKLQITVWTRETVNQPQGSNPRAVAWILQTFRFGFDELQRRPLRRAEDADAFTQHLAPATRPPIFSRRVTASGLSASAAELERPLDSVPYLDVVVSINYSSTKSGEINAEYIPTESHVRTYGGTAAETICLWIRGHRRRSSVPSCRRAHYAV